MQKGSSRRNKAVGSKGRQTLGQILLSVLIGLFFITPYLISYFRTNRLEAEANPTYFVWVCAVLCAALAAFAIDKIFRPSQPRKSDPGAWLAVVGALATGIFADESLLANVKDRFAVGIWVLSVSAGIAGVAAFVSWRKEASQERRISALQKENRDLTAYLGLLGEENTQLKAANNHARKEAQRAAGRDLNPGQQAVRLSMALAAVGGAVVLMAYRSRRRSRD